MNRDRGVDGNENEERTGMGTWVGMGARTGVGMGTGSRLEGRVEGKESLGNGRSSNRDGSEDAKGGATPTSCQQPQPQDPTPQQDR